MMLICFVITKKHFFPPTAPQKWTKLVFLGIRGRAGPNYLVGHNFYKWGVKSPIIVLIQIKSMSCSMTIMIHSFMKAYNVLFLIIFLILCTSCESKNDG